MDEIVKLYQDHPVRIIERDGDPWFVAKDVCDILEICNSRRSTSLLDEDERGVHTVNTPSGKQEMTVVSEAGLYSLILKSRKPEAKAFRRWVTHEVLPAIRKTGAYVVPNRAMEAMGKILLAVKEQYQMLVEGNAVLRQQMEYLMQFAPKTQYGAKAPNGKRRTTIRRGANVAGNGRLIERRNPDEVGYQMDLFGEYLPQAIFADAVNIININCPNLLETAKA
ncbi:MAG: phage antirepressor [Clostridia bacterium]|nr:phage antirepressor [Clostridia bacterium]